MLDVLDNHTLVLINDLIARINDALDDNVREIHSNENGQDILGSFQNYDGSTYYITGSNTRTYIIEKGNSEDVSPVYDRDRKFIIGDKNGIYFEVYPYPTFSTDTRHFVGGIHIRRDYISAISDYVNGYCLSMDNYASEGEEYVNYFMYAIKGLEVGKTYTFTFYIHEADMNEEGTDGAHLLVLKTADGGTGSTNRYCQINLATGATTDEGCSGTTTIYQIPATGKYVYRDGSYTMQFTAEDTEVYLYFDYSAIIADETDITELSVEGLLFSTMNLGVLSAQLYFNGKWYSISASGSGGGGSIIEGYYKVADGKFYEESTYETEIAGVEDLLYIDLTSKMQFIFDGTNFVNITEDAKPTVSEASTRANLASGDTLATIIGKIKKFFADLKTVAFSGSYNDLSDKPTIPAAQVNSDWDASSGVAKILNKPTLATVATSGSYNDLSNKPTIPTVNDGTLVIKQNGTTKATFTANQSGNSEADITVPDVTEVDTTETKPYLYRASQATGDRLYDKLVGCSFGVNQLIQLGSNTFERVSVTFSRSGNYWNVNGTATDLASDVGACFSEVQTVSGHKYILGILGNTKVKSYEYIHNAIQARKAGLYMAQGDGGVFQLRAVIEKNVTYSNEKFIGVCIDLTLHFASDPSIADKAYTLEQATAGSGIAWLKSYGFFTKDYYPYNTGSLVSVKPTAHKLVGKNILDPQVLFTQCGGTTETNRVVTYTAQAISGVNLTPNLPFKENTQYSFIFTGYGSAGKTNICFRYTDGTANSFSCSTSKGTYVLPSDGSKTIKALEGYWVSGNTTIYCDECAILEGEKSASDFEPYNPIIYPLNTELRGVATLSGNDIVYDGDENDGSGSTVRKYLEPLDLGSLNWENWGNYLFVSNAISNVKIPSSGYNTNVVCAKYPVGNTDKTIRGIGTSGSIAIQDSSYSTAAAFKTAMNGVYLVAEAATPTTESSIPFDNPQICDPNGTEEYVDTRDVPIPVGHTTKYVNLPDWMEDGYYKDFRERVDKYVSDNGVLDSDGNVITGNYLKTPTVIAENIEANGAAGNISGILPNYKALMFVAFRSNNDIIGSVVVPTALAASDGVKTMIPVYTDGTSTHYVYLSWEQTIVGGSIVMSFVMYKNGSIIHHVNIYGL